jgi:hypothetical protein
MVQPIAVPVAAEADLVVVVVDLMGWAVLVVL